MAASDSLSTCWGGEELGRGGGEELGGKVGWRGLGGNVLYEIDQCTAFGPCSVCSRTHCLGGNLLGGEGKRLAMLRVGGHGCQESHEKGSYPCFAISVVIPFPLSRELGFDPGMFGRLELAATQPSTGLFVYLFAGLFRG